MPVLKEYKPRKYTLDEMNDLELLFSKYIETTEFPHLSKFASENGIIREDLYLFPSFVPLIKKAKDKCEAYLIGKLEKDQLYGKYAFLLKSMHQFRDNSTLTVQGEQGKPIALELTSKSIEALQESMLKGSKANKAMNTAKPSK